MDGSGRRVTRSGRSTKVWPGALGGTRHLSAAQFVRDQPDALALVASQDGRFTIFAWSPCEDAGDKAQGRTPADNATVRSVFVIGPDKKVKAMLTYPMSTGRNFDEVLRLLDSCQLTAKHKVATPVNWQQGQDVIIVPAVSDADAKAAYPGGWKSPKPYIRIVPQPK